MYSAQRNLNPPQREAVYQYSIAAKRLLRIEKVCLAGLLAVVAVFSLAILFPALKAYIPEKIFLLTVLAGAIAAGIALSKNGLIRSGCVAALRDADIHPEVIQEVIRYPVAKLPLLRVVHSGAPSSSTNNPFQSRVSSL